MFSGVRSSCKKQACAGRSLIYPGGKISINFKVIGQLVTWSPQPARWNVPKWTPWIFSKRQNQNRCQKFNRSVTHWSCDILSNCYKGVFSTYVFLSSSYLSFSSFHKNVFFVFLRRSKMDLVSFLGMVYRLHKVPWVPMGCWFST